MKTKIYIFCLSIIAMMALFSCEKDPSGNGSLHITVQYHNQPMPGAKVYLKMGVYDHPNFTDSQYDGILTADGGGTVTFSNLTPGKYYVKATVYSNQALRGDSIATVLRRFRGDNSNNFTIELY